MGVDDLIISELLTSAKHAINAGKPVDNVVLTFARFYNEGEILVAREKLEGVGAKLPQRKTARNTVSKEAALTEVLKALVDLDAKGTDIVFAAVNLNRICFVEDGLNDEIQMRSVVTSVTKKMEDLETSYHDVVTFLQSLNDRTSSACTEIKKIVAEAKMDASRGALFSSVVQTTPASTPLSPPPAHSASEIKVTKIVPQPLPLRTSPQIQTVKLMTPPKRSTAPRPVAPEELSPSDPRNPQGAGRGEDVWKTVSNRRRKLTVIGTATTSIIKTVKPTRPTNTISSIFISRCAPETTVEQMREYCSNERSLEVSDVEKITSTRSNNHCSSFRVDFRNQGNWSTKVLKPENWPKNMIVRKWYPARQTAEKRPDGNSTAHDDDD